MHITLNLRPLEGAIMKIYDKDGTDLTTEFSNLKAPKVEPVTKHLLDLSWVREMFPTAKRVVVVISNMEIDIAL